ncbi:MAG: hypothetical protein UX39_C0010G0014 [Candidatus Magasanikbacteria bacterium GW2011_GWA2_46_17]|uniref:Uncharacterized protein n=1 Tax=Candidatus Magasanikbacteria bacterium GW2011_GWA2_46_17 TaxID=1619042 RepID=A0A0G1P111_9BACT|nr:MAG: hypothetical protein UX39_C0010G0014 [Candidatus Magasanikbacteria bacterium GW2011_GWA2_46_17]
MLEMVCNILCVLLVVGFFFSVCVGAYYEIKRLDTGDQSLFQYGDCALRTALLMFYTLFLVGIVKCSVWGP